MEEMVKKPFLSLGNWRMVRAFYSLMSHWPNKVFMVYSRIFATVFLISSVVVAQSIDPGKTGTVHVYREGRLLMGVVIVADGRNVASLSPQKIATFYVVPGYHELILESGDISPTVSFRAEAGGEYFFQASYEDVRSATSTRDLRVSLSMQQEPIAGEDEFRQVAIDPGKLMEVLALGNPCGAKPTEQYLVGAKMDADAIPRDRSNCSGENRVTGQ